MREQEARIPIVRTEAKEEYWAGRMIGPYMVQKRLSKGGMGVVLLAYDEALRRQVALKVMEQKLLTDGDALKRFEREARASAAIQHRNIAQIYLVGLSEDGLPFLAMEYIDGGSLMDAIRQRRALSFTQVAALMEQVASALQAASRLNIIHRDIKPANIMLTRDGEARVVDFGLAKIFFEDSYMTQEGMVLGTPSYMAPEQSQGRVVDHRADIYSLGATFYHLILGRPPYTADSPVQIMMKHVTAPLIPMRSINPTVPIEFDEIIGRCMRKDVDERYQDYESLLFDIKRVRLMCQTREQGAVIGGDGCLNVGSQPTGVGSSILPPPPPARSTPARSSGMVIPPPPGSFGEGAATPSVRVRHAAGAVPLEQMNAGEQEAGWTPAKIGMAGAAGLLVLAAIGFALTSGESKKETEEKPREANPIAKILDRANQNARAARRGGADAPENEYFSFLDTQDIMSEIRNGIVAWHSLNNEFPASLKELIAANRVVITFDQDDGGNPLDRWGTAIRYDSFTGQLRSAGMDRRFQTGDDLVMPFEGEMVVPAAYERMEISN
jgi:serine/threonine protein kinase